MLELLRKLLTRNTGLKLMALVLSLAIWIYIVNELKKGSEEERRFLNRVLPQESLTAKKLPINPIFTGSVRSGYMIDDKKVAVAPDYCLVVGTRDLLDKIRFAYTMPVDVTGENRAFTRSVSLSPIAPGVYMDETLVQVTVPVERMQSQPEVGNVETRR